jgi:hypothetical protein
MSKDNLLEMAQKVGYSMHAPLMRSMGKKDITRMIGI